MVGRGQSNLAFLRFVPTCFSFLFHAAQRMQKAAKIKKKAVCRMWGLLVFLWHVLCRGRGLGGAPGTETMWQMGFSLPLVGQC